MQEHQYEAKTIRSYAGQILKNSEWNYDMARRDYLLLGGQSFCVVLLPNWSAWTIRLWRFQMGTKIQYCSTEVMYLVCTSVKVQFQSSLLGGKDKHFICCNVFLWYCRGESNSFRWSWLKGNSSFARQDKIIKDPAVSHNRLPHNSNGIY